LSQQAIVIDQTGRRLQLPSLLIDMDDVFENYIREVLRRAADTDSWTCAVLDGNAGPPKGAGWKVFRDPGDEQVVTSPDVVCRRRDTQQPRDPVVLEVKYKPTAARVDRDHLDQGLTYGLTYGAEHVVIVQPLGFKPAHTGLRRLGTVGGITCHVYSIDLSADLDLEERDLQTAVRGLIDSVTYTAPATAP
jgi:hypothetical protein